jgi:hypothetical protein
MNLIYYINNFFNIIEKNKQNIVNINKIIDIFINSIIYKFDYTFSTREKCYNIYYSTKDYEIDDIFTKPEITKKKIIYNLIKKEIILDKRFEIYKNF